MQGEAVHGADNSKRPVWLSRIFRMFLSSRFSRSENWRFLTWTYTVGCQLLQIMFASALCVLRIKQAGFFQHQNPSPH